MSRLGILYFCALCSSIEAAKILAVLPTPAISHNLVFRSLTHGLAKRGHEIVVITTDPAFPKSQAPENLTEIDVHDISYNVWSQLTKKDNDGEKSTNSKKLSGVNDLILRVFEKQTEVAEVRNIIESKNITFDLLLVEAWTRCVLGFSHAFKVPVIAVSSFGAILDNNDVMGAPSHPVLYPQSSNTRLYNLTLWEKLNMYYDYYFLTDQFKKAEVNENAVLRRVFGEDTTDLSQLQNNINMMLLNSRPLWEGSRPVPPGVVHVGGMHQKPQKELPQDLKQYLDSSIHGVIYLSFGTSVDPSTLPVDKIQAIISVFSKLPYDVLWKWHQDELPGRTKNIRVSKWFPQSDFLRHPKIKVFITQGGLQSIDEAISAGVPVIGIPMIADQWYNAEKFENHRIGKKIYLADLNEETLTTAIKTIIEDKSYRDNVIRLRTLMNDQPMTSLERAVWWTEHVLRHGGARHLRAPAANMGWWEYYDMQLVLIVLSIAMTVILLGSLVLYNIIKLILRFISGSVKIKNL